MEQNKVYRFEGEIYHEDGITLCGVWVEWPSDNLAITSAYIWGSDEGVDLVKVFREENSNGERTEVLIANLTL